MELNPAARRAAASPARSAAIVAAEQKARSVTAALTAASIPVARASAHPFHVELSNMLTVAAHPDEA